MGFCLLTSSTVSFPNPGSSLKYIHRATLEIITTGFILPVNKSSRVLVCSLKIRPEVEFEIAHNVWNTGGKYPFTIVAYHNYNTITFMYYASVKTFCSQHEYFEQLFVLPFISVNLLKVMMTGARTSW